MDIQTRIVNCLLITSLLCANSASAYRRTYDIVVAGKSCTETSTQSIDCQYNVGKDLQFTIDGIGQPDTGVTFVKSSFEGDFYASFGIQHGCVIVKRGQKGVTSQELSGPDSAFDFAFVSPKNGKVYRRWEECQTAFRSSMPNNSFERDHAQMQTPSHDAGEDVDSPRVFFGKNKIGASPDFGIVKFGNIEDHVITVHGFSDDLASCQEIIKALNKNACKGITDGSACLDPFSCQPLNH